VHQLWCTGALSVKVPAESVARRPGIGYSSVVARRDPQQFYEGFIAVFRRVRAVAEQGYAPLEIGTAQAKLLRHIGQDSRISQADLARATGTAPTLTGRALEPLIERGWVRRKRSAEDRRQYVLELSAAGQRARERVLQVRSAIIERLVAALDEPDMADFERIAAKILAAFESEEPAALPRARAR
jgi:DNA-binding MarR family transcriptional regulator